MQTISNVKPTSNFEIEEYKNKKCVLFYTNVQENTTEEEAAKYTYDFYRLSMRYRNNLKESIENNYDKWLEFAKTQEEESLAKEIRAKRDKLLTSTDWTQCVDTALSEEEQEEYKTYRQALRDITGQEGFPYKVEFPKLGGIK